jgi:DNA invertase Pin-like site-specific DNA recombinase
MHCAICTRKSSEDGLEQSFNSLDAQREACEAFLISQRHEGWKALPDRCDDGGFSGGTMERPALKRLLQEAEAGINALVKAFGRSSKDWMNQVLTVEIDELPGKKYPFYLIPEGYKRIEDKKGDSVILPEADALIRTL